MKRTRIVAGPGTGKTYKLRQEISRLLEEGVAPSKILLITFSRNSAKDLINELQSINVGNISEIAASTLHSFCYRMLQSSEASGRASRFLHSFEVKFLEEDLKLELEIGIRDVQKNTKAFEAGWARLQHESPGWPDNEEDRKFEYSLNNWLEFHNCSLIGEVVKEALAYLRENPLAKERTEYDYVFVDEYQDLNRAEQELIKIIAEKSSLMIIGDEDQSIYEGFRYAHPEGILEFDKYHENVEDIFLEECRRCPQQVVAVANYFIKNNINRNSAKKFSARAENRKGDIYKLQWPNLQEEADGIAEYIENCVKQGRFVEGKILVLTPRRQIADVVRQNLVRREIGSYSYFKEDIISGNPKKDKAKAQEAVTLLALANNPEDKVALRCWLGFDHSSLQAKPYAKLRDYSAHNNCSIYNLLKSICNNSFSMNGLGKIPERFNMLEHKLVEIADLTGRDLIEYLFPLEKSQFEYLRARLEAHQVADSYSISSLHRAVVDILSKNEIPTNVDHVRIMSLHSSKGLTADLVVICGFVKGLIPHDYSNSSDYYQNRMKEEQRRLFYVGLTRTTDTLIISSATKISGQNPYQIGATISRYGNTFPSPFIREMGPNAPDTVSGQEWLLSKINKSERETEQPTNPSMTNPENSGIGGDFIVNIFISYAHAHRDYSDVFIQDFRNHTNNLTYEVKVYTDEQIPLGENWHQDIQKAVAKCDIAILLVSDAFMNSQYIKKHEVENLVKRMSNEDNNVRLIPVYFYPCNFQDWPFLSKYQFFKPLGKDYGRADKDIKNKFCYSHLIEFNAINGVNIPQPNLNRSEYMMDFVEKLKPHFEKAIGK